jgi:hypothetical protein
MTGIELRMRRNESAMERLPNTPGLALINDLSTFRDLRMTLLRIKRILGGLRFQGSRQRLRDMCSSHQRSLSDKQQPRKTPATTASTKESSMFEIDFSRKLRSTTGFSSTQAITKTTTTKQRTTPGSSEK